MRKFIDFNFFCKKIKKEKSESVIAKLTEIYGK